MQLTIVYTTSRLHPKVRWFFDSLRKQIQRDDQIQVIIVDRLIDQPGRRERFRQIAGFDFVHTDVKPTVWQGAHRVTQQDWWAVSNARNTGICLCRTNWLCLMDDRCVLIPGFLDSIREAMAGSYGVAGAYEKRWNMKVINGTIEDWGKLDGSDPRSPGGKDHRENMVDSKLVECPGSWWFGACTALPLEWALNINGYLELLDGTSHEDCFFGEMLKTQGYPLKYDSRMRIVEDRTPGETGPDYPRTSKDRFHHDVTDRCHTAIKRFLHLPFAPNNFNIREVRDRMLRGEPWPMPPEKDYIDWFDGEPVKDFTWPYICKRP